MPEKKYFVIPETNDGCSISTVPDPLPLADVGNHIAEYLAARAHRGYFSNANRERIPLDELSFRIVPENEEGGYFGL